MGTTPGWEDWDEDGNPGVTGVRHGHRHRQDLRRDRACGRSSPAAAADISSLFKLPSSGIRRRICCRTTARLCSHRMGVRAADPSLHFAQLARLCADQATGDDAAICNAIRRARPHANARSRGEIRPTMSKLFTGAKCVFALLFIYGIALSSGSAHASPLLDLTGDTTGRRRPAGAHGARWLGGGVFQSRAADRRPAELTLGFMLLSQDIGIALDGRPGTQFAVPDRPRERRARRWHALRQLRRSPPTCCSTGVRADGRREPLAPRPRQAAGTGHETGDLRSLRPAR